jgi:hypothetical protein
MRRIMSERDKEKSRKRNQVFMGGVLIFIMLFSTVGFAFLNNSDSSNGNYVDSVEYEGVDFDSDGYYWYFVIDGIEFVTLYNPQELIDEGVNFQSLNSLTNYHNQPLYYVGSDEGSAEIDRNLRSRFVLRTGMACLEGDDCEEDLPVKDCSENVVVFREIEDDLIGSEIEGENEKIYREDKCVFIVAKKVNMAKYADAFLFDILDL